MEFTFNAFYTLIAAVIVLLLGRFLVNKIGFLKRYNIPEACRRWFSCSDYLLGCA